MSNTYYKPVQSLISDRKETYKTIEIKDNDVVHIKCSRTSLTKNSNYFLSFGLPHKKEFFSTGSTLSLNNPELQQLNVDEFVMIPIPNNKYSDIIDGRSIKVEVLSGSSGTHTLYSSTYSQLKKSQDSVLLGNNIAFLFSDDINLPRSGTTNGGTVSSNRSSWSNHPVAHAYSDLKPSDINTDKRPWGSVNLAVTSVTENYPTSTNQGYNYDVPVGFVALDKGFIIITHPTIVSSIPWTGNTLEESFVGSTVLFKDISIDFKTSVVCMALPDEFIFSTNPSWDFSGNVSEFQGGTNGFDKVMVTEIGLYNKKNELIAVAKTDRPVEKDSTGLITFNLDINV